MNALKAVHPQDSGWPVEITLSHLKTIIIAGWQNAAIYTKRTWLLNTFSASLTQRRLVCQLVKTVYPPKQPTNQPIKTFFLPSRSEFSVICPICVVTKSKVVVVGGALW